MTGFHFLAFFEVRWRYMTEFWAVEYTLLCMFPGQSYGNLPQAPSTLLPPPQWPWATCWTQPTHCAGSLGPGASVLRTIQFTVNSYLTMNFYCVKPQRFEWGWSTDLRDWLDTESSRTGGVEDTMDFQHAQLCEWRSHLMMGGILSRKEDHGVYPLYT